MREQRFIVLRRLAELKEIELMERAIRRKSPTKPIDHSTNARLYLKQMDHRVNSPSIAASASSTLQTQFEKRSRSNLPYGKKPTEIRSDLSETMIGDVTTAATASPTFRHPLSINGSSELAQGNRLAEVSEESKTPGRNILVSDNYRKSRMLAKGCPKLLKLIERNAIDFDKSVES